MLPSPVGRSETCTQSRIPIVTNAPSIPYVRKLISMVYTKSQYPTYTQVQQPPRGESWRRPGKNVF